MLKTFCDICKREINDLEEKYSLSFSRHDTVEGESEGGYGIADMCTKCFKDIHEAIEAMKI